MKDGALVEAGATADVFCAPQHEYTRALLEAVPGREWSRHRESAILSSIPAA